MKLLVLDGNSILNRAFYGIKLLSTKNGEFTNGIYGFLTMLRRLLDETEPDAVAIAFDRKAPTFRHKQYAGYKANRKGMPPELAGQLPVLQELLTSLGYRIVSCEGWEVFRKKRTWFVNDFCQPVYEVWLSDDGTFRSWKKEFLSVDGDRRICHCF